MSGPFVPKPPEVDRTIRVTIEHLPNRRWGRWEWDVLEGFTRWAYGTARTESKARAKADRAVKRVLRRREQDVRVVAASWTVAEDQS